MTQTKTRTLNIGMIGIGVGGAEILPAMEAMETINLMAGADVVPARLERFKKRYPNARTYDSAEGLCRDPDIEAVWISSPNRFHTEHTILAARHGKHAVVEKPMAINLADAQRALSIWSYSDWMLRPRTADELDLAQGGGIPYRQGPHQVDTVRLLGGGLLRSVRAQVGRKASIAHRRPAGARDLPPRGARTVAMAFGSLGHGHPGGMPGDHGLRARAA